MSQLIGLVTVLVPSYTTGIQFFCNTLGFQLIEDTALDDTKRWVVVAPSGDRGTRLLLAQPADEAQAAQVGKQTGGRVGFFLYTSDLQSDYQALQAKGVEFVRTPQTNEYGQVAVFKDCSGNLWDLLQPTASNVAAAGL